MSNSNPSDTSAVQQPDSTPRNSDNRTGEIESQGTPYGTLRNLATIPKPTTPIRPRASSAGPISIHNRSLRRTPLTQARTPGTAPRNGGSGRRANAPTPHARAAFRELEARRAGLTPAKERRRSGRQQRETPRDPLRQLSKLLAPVSNLTVETPPVEQSNIRKFQSARRDDDDDGFVPDRPRLSLPLGDEDDEDESLLLPPQSAGLEDDNFTVQSIELPRRATSEQAPLGWRRSRGSFGRTSDRFGDLMDAGLGGFSDTFDSSVLPEGGFRLDAQDLSELLPPRELTEAVDNFDVGRDRDSGVSARFGDIRLGPFPDEADSSFALEVPQRDDPEEDQIDDTAVDLPADQLDDALEPSDAGEDEVEDVEEIEEEQSDEEPNALEATFGLDISAHNVGLSALITAAKPKGIKKRKIKVSKHGIQYPSLPMGVVKKLATKYARTSGNSKTTLSKDTMDAIMQASDWFFEQVSDDLGTYAEHAGRKTIEEKDMIALLSRQRQISSSVTPFSLAEKYLPRELLQELRMMPAKKGR